MNAIEWIKQKFWGRGGQAEQMFLWQLAAEAYYKLLAVETCVSFIANTLLACEFQTFENGQEIRKNMHYLLNVRPNQNQSAATFWHEVIGKLYRDNEALVVQHANKFFIADCFNVEPYVLYDSLYTNVQVGDYTFYETFKATDVFHFRLSGTDVSKLLDQVYEGYGKLLSAAQGNYKRKNTPRMIIDIDAQFSPNDDNQKSVREYLGKQFKTFYEADGAGVVQPLYKGMALNKSFNPFASNAIYTTRDIRALVDDIFDMVSMAFHIPGKLIKGDMVNTDALTDLYIMGCAKPLARIIRDEINAKAYTQAQYQARTMLKIDTSKVAITDIAKLATAADKLFAAGVNTINDNLRLLDREPDSNPKADERFTTKNYTETSALEGGEADAST